MSHTVIIDGKEVDCDRHTGRCESPIIGGIEPTIVTAYNDDAILYEEEVLECE